MLRRLCTSALAAAIAWSLHLGERDRVEVSITTASGSPPQTTPVRSARELTTALTRALRPEVMLHVVHPYPQLSRLVCLWARRRMWTRRRSEYKTRTAAASRCRGRQNLKKRKAKWATCSKTVAYGLEQLEWKRIRRVFGQGPWGEQLLLRLKLHALSLYDITQHRLGCPHPSCTHEQNVELYHVFWTCPAASDMRREMLRTWKRLGLQSRDCELAVFSMKLPGIPAGIWALMEEHLDRTPNALPQLAAAVTELTKSFWRIGVVIYLNAVWRWRVQHFDALNNVTRPHHKAALINRLRQGYHSVHLHLSTIQRNKYSKLANSILLRAFKTQVHILQRRITTSITDLYIHFFYGGSRGNPGPGGSGAIILRIGLHLTSITVCWIGHTSYASTNTTNNVAENMGLLMGLRACKQFNYTPVQVIGDNKMIIRQHQQRNAPKAAHLKNIYWICRRLAEELQAVKWIHHLRCHNKMADSLANLAMDTRRSVQVCLDRNPTMQQRWSAVLQHLKSDMTQWYETNGNAGFDDDVDNLLQ